MRGAEVAEKSWCAQTFCKSKWCRAASADSREVADGIVLDFDADGRLVGIDIDHASQVVDLSRLNVVALPVQAAEFAAS